MTFDSPSNFWFLFLIIPAFVTFLLRNKYVPALYGNLPSIFARCFGFLLILISFVCLVFGLSSPSITKISYPYKDLRLFFLLDVSKSMAYVEDIKPNRLSAAKNEIKNAYYNMNGSYYSSLILFSGAVNKDYCPLTPKKNTFLKLLSDANEYTVDVPGTDMEGAFSSLAMISEEYKINSGKNIVVLLSDGGKEDSFDIDRSKILNVINDLKNKGFVFYVVGIGDVKPAPLVRRVNGKFISYYPEKNKILTTVLDEDILKLIAHAGGGKYRRFDHPGILSNFLVDVTDSYKELDYSAPYTEMKSIKHYFYGISCFLFAVLMLINRRF